MPQTSPMSWNTLSIMPLMLINMVFVNKLKTSYKSYYKKNTNKMHQIKWTL